jgi:hypothetical protein
MSDPTRGHEEDLIDIYEASDLIEVPAEMIRNMVDEDLLVPVVPAEADEDLRFRRADVLAVRELGG